MDDFDRIKDSFNIIDAIELPEQSQDWEQPKPIKREIATAPKFEARLLLPQQLAEFVLDESDRMKAAPDFIGAALLVAMGAVIGAQIAVKPKRRDDWLITPNLWGAVVGEPSSKKTPSASAAMRFVDALETIEQDRMAEELQSYIAELAVYSAREGALVDDMKTAAKATKATDAESAKKMAAAQAAMADLIKPEPPAGRRFRTNDSTSEKLADIQSKNPNGLLVFRDELMGLLSSWEKAGREGDRAFYLEGWNGTGSYSTDRIGRGSQRIKNHCLSIFGGIQPELLERYLADMADSLDNDGRVQRFQVMVFPEKPEWEWVDKYPIAGAREAVRDVFSSLAKLDPEQMGAEPVNEFVKLPHLHFDEDAQEEFIKWATELNKVKLPNETDSMMNQHLSKFEKLFCAVALTLHLASGDRGSITVDSALRAGAWCEYLEGHARRIYGLTGSAQTKAAQLIASRISAGKLANDFTARELTRKGWRGIKTAGTVEAALNILEEHGWIRGHEESNPIGRPTTRFSINPMARGAV